MYLNEFFKVSFDWFVFFFFFLWQNSVAHSTWKKHCCGRKWFTLRWKDPSLSNAMHTRMNSAYTQTKHARNSYALLHFIRGKERRQSCVIQCTQTYIHAQHIAHVPHVIWIWTIWVTTMREKRPSNEQIKWLNAQVHQLQSKIRVNCATIKTITKLFIIDDIETKYRQMVFWRIIFLLQFENRKKLKSTKILYTIWNRLWYKHKHRRSHSLRMI